MANMTEDLSRHLESAVIERAAYARLAIGLGDAEEARYYATTATRLAHRIMAERGEADIVWLDERYCIDMSEIRRKYDRFGLESLLPPYKLR